MRTFSRSAFAAFLVLSVPLIASAQSISSVTTLISSLINYTIGILIGLTIIGFFWGLFKYLKAGADQADKKKGAMYMIQGVIALAVMLSVYGLVRLLQNTFGVGNNATIPPPSVGQLQITQQ